MEHIRQGSDQHASGTLDVAEDVSSFWPGTQLGAILTFPIGDKLQEPVTVPWCTYGGHAAEYLPQPAGIRRLGRGSTPGQSLSLNVDQTSLNDRSRPELMDKLHDIRVTIDREAGRTQSHLLEVTQKIAKLGFGTLGYPVFSRHNHMGLRIHQGNHALWAMEESAIQDEVTALTQAIRTLWHRLIQATIDNPVKLCWAMSTLLGQLANGITLAGPAPEPLPLSIVFCRRIAPGQRMLTGGAKIALSSVGEMAIFLKRCRTPGTVFFCSNLTSSLKEFSDRPTILRSSQA